MCRTHWVRSGKGLSIEELAALRRTGGRGLAPSRTKRTAPVGEEVRVMDPVAVV